MVEIAPVYPHWHVIERRETVPDQPESRTIIDHGACASNDLAARTANSLAEFVGFEIEHDGPRQAHQVGYGYWLVYPSDPWCPAYTAVELRECRLPGCEVQTRPSCPHCDGKLVGDGTMSDGTELFIRNRVGCAQCDRHYPRKDISRETAEGGPCPFCDSKLVASAVSSESDFYTPLLACLGCGRMIPRSLLSDPGMIESIRANRERFT